MPDRHGSGQALHFFMDMEIPESQQLNPPTRWVISPHRIDRQTTVYQAVRCP